MSNKNPNPAIQQPSVSESEAHQTFLSLNADEKRKVIDFMTAVKKSDMKTAEALRSEVRENKTISDIEHLSDIDLLRLHKAIQQVIEGDKQAIRKLANRLQKETEELEQAIIAGYRPEQFKAFLAKGLEVQL